MCCQRKGVKKMNTKKILAGLSAFALMLSVMVVPVFAKVETVPGGWDVSGVWVFDYHYNDGVNLHDMTLIQDVDGNLTGYGGAFAGDLPYDYPWTITGGLVNGDAIDFTADYDALPCSFTVTGTIAPNGTMIGEWTDDCFGNREGTWATTEGKATRFEGNHGQYVNSQENKQDAAQSRVGMPVQSNGHVE